MLYTCQTTANWSNRKSNVWNETYPETVQTQPLDCNLSDYLHPMLQLFAEIHALLKNENN